jgi:hypothetical protein
MATGASEYYYIPELDKDGKRARLEAMTDTSSRGGLSSSVQMQFADQTGPNFTFEMCGDFRKIVLSTKNLRGTQKAINTHHSMAFSPESVQALKAEALAFYAAKAVDRR